MATAPSICVLPGALLRCAGWPVETALAYGAPALQKLARAVARHDQQTADRTAAFIDALHAAVPLLAEQARAARRYLLAVKRHCYQHATPFAAPPPGFREQLASENFHALLRQERAARTRAAACRARYQQLFADTLQQQQGALLETARNDRFQQALLLANAPLWQLLQPGAPLPPAKQHRLEATLFFYLMRAVGRPTPHLGWAGVAPVQPAASTGGRLRVEPAPEACQATVALPPFAQALGALAALPRYRAGYPLRLNPTLAKTAAGWVYERRQQGQYCPVEIPDFPLDELVVDFFADGKARCIEPLLAVLAARHGLDANLLRAVKDRLLAVDILRVDLALPVQAATAWHALEAVLPHLLPPDQPPWLAAIRQCQRACGRLEQAQNQPGTEAIRQALGDVKAAVQQLWAHCGLAGPLPSGLVFLDVRAPFCGIWDAAARTAAAGALRQWLAFHHAEGSAERYRQQTYAAAKCQTGAAPSLAGALAHLARQKPATAPELATAPGSVHPYTQAQVFTRFAAPATDPGPAAAQARRWLAWLEPAHRRRRLAVPAGWGRALPPQWQCGSVLLPLWGPGAWCVGPGRPQPGLFATRFAALLHDGPAGPDALLPAIRQQFAELARAGIPSVEVFGDDCANPNAALRPPLATAALAPPDGRAAAVALRYDDDAHRLWLAEPGQPAALPLYNSAAAIGHASPAAQLLWLSTMTHGWEYLSYGVLPVARELTTWQHRPRLLAPGGTVLSEERWIIGGETLRRLAQQPGPARYVQWQQELRRRRVPAIVYAHWSAQEAPILLVASSPLAVDSLFFKMKSDAPAWLVLHELPGDLRALPVQDAQGQHYIAELAVSWFYQGLTPRPPAHAAAEPSC